MAWLSCQTTRAFNAGEYHFHNVNMVKIKIKFPGKFAHLVSREDPEGNLNLYISILKLYINELISFLEKYQRFYDFQASDFLLKTLWKGQSHFDRNEDERCEEILPSEVCDAIDNMNLEDLIGMVCKCEHKGIWPQTLIEIVRQAHSLSLPREQSNHDETIQIERGMQFGLNAKKLHEVSHMSYLIHEMCESMDEQPTIVDLGAGQAYLSSILSHQLGYSVIAFDNDEIQERGSQKRTRRLDKITRKRNVGSFKYSNKYITSENELEEESLVKFSKKIMIGLHACGDLTPSIIKLFLQNDSAIGCVVAGCCYNLVETSFPLSEHVGQMRGFKLGKSAKSLASQSIWRWGVKQSLKEVHLMFRKHLFRALLQVILYETGKFDWEAISNVSVGNVPKRCFTKFSEYCRYCSSKLGIQIYKSGKLIYPMSFFFTTIEPYLDQLYVDVEKSSFMRLAGTWSVRALFSSVIESLLISDRLLYILENGHRFHIQEVALIPAFDPQISPRNFVIYSRK